MAEPFLGEIRLMSFNFPPKGWALCNGQLLPINQNQPLFALLGTYYGGDGRVNFALPNFQGRVGIHQGGGYTMGQQGGEYTHTLSQNEIPQHIHFVNANSAANGGNAVPTGRFLGGANHSDKAPTNLFAINPKTIGNTGGSQAHENRAPSSVISFCIALQGIFPSQN
jgi:microcystin-dependent protein